MKSIVPVSVLLTVLFLSVVRAEVVTEEVTYEGGGATMEGLLAWDDDVEGPRPGVLVVHEWWGHNDYVRKRARMLAELGYLALAVDMYGGGKQADHPKEAGQFSREVMSNLETARKRFEAALEFLNSRPRKHLEKTAAIGYCFGGSVVLHMARLGVDLDGVVSFHGSLDAKVKAQPDEVEARILVCNGAADPLVSDESVEAFKAEMDAAGADYEFINYPGAKHGFTNPAATEKGQEFGLPLAYQKEADEDSWQKMKEFFGEIFAE